MPTLLSSASADLDAVVEFDPVIIGKMSQSGPRYTSYPTADRFTADFGYGNFLEALAALRMRGGRRPLSLYVHVPFCDTLCYYCACNKIITKDRSKAATYLSYLKQEIAMQGKLFAGMNQIEQLHFGGGTPTYLSEKQMDELMLHLRQHFEFASDEDGEYSIEIDPRRANACFRCAHKALTASAWACRISTPTCKKPSTASSRKRKRWPSCRPRATPVSARSAST